MYCTLYIILCSTTHACPDGLITIKSVAFGLNRTQRSSRKVSSRLIHAGTRQMGKGASSSRSSHGMQKTERGKRHIHTWPRPMIWQAMGIKKSNVVLRTIINIIQYWVSKPLVIERRPYKSIRHPCPHVLFIVSFCVCACLLGKGTYRDLSLNLSNGPVQLSRYHHLHVIRQ